MADPLTLDEVSAILGVDTAELIRLIYGGQLGSVVKDGRLMVPADDNALAERASQTPARR